MKPFISLDWGTSSFRAYEVNAEGKVVNQTSAPEGILAVKDQKFEETLETHIGSWDKSLPVIASGMITSRQGWVECAYAECPADASALAKSITTKTTTSARNIHFITGLHYESPSIGHDVIRGEETQVFGALATGAKHFITPGTHSKWIDVENAQVIGFATYMTGESFALYKNNSILGRLMQDGPQDDKAFARGIEKAFSDPAALLHQLFSVRTLGLFNDLPPESLASYLSGLLVGQEVAHATIGHDQSAAYLVLASPALGAAYITALKLAGLDVKLGDPLCAIDGQRLIAHEAGLI
ncbi:2-dehydro-3-deoxygalactonokinase [Aestuariivirga litoralis]|uniref:2-dehydro-3-deoxygalactonokinase n=1 Tax=Aestuariivirga litoralis TaxID=2650924 RepID=UPI0018C70D68|nr:2-dehydro-3-deoxygalactonokinase [Aestuariivirga litoralis]MBG1233607.1 2-dehydro-3-deoxygalactonokinase [Aestuariivirga litoralis]